MILNIACLSAMKRSSLQKSLSKFIFKKFYEKVLCNKATEETFLRPQTFIVKFLVIGIYTKTGFYSRVEIKGHRPSGT